MFNLIKQDYCFARFITKWGHVLTEAMHTDRKMDTNRNTHTHKFPPRSHYTHAFSVTGTCKFCYNNSPMNLHLLKCVGCSFKAQLLLWKWTFPISGLCCSLSGFTTVQRGNVCRQLSFFHASGWRWQFASNQNIHNEFSGAALSLWPNFTWRLATTSRGQSPTSQGTQIFPKWLQVARELATAVTDALGTRSCREVKESPS